MTLTYALIDGGYALFSDGVLWISQPFQPDVPFVDGKGVPFPDEASATAAAVALVAELTPADESPENG
jgi:hypothetical protein